jgi:hypothetical protein
MVDEVRPLLEHHFQKPTASRVCDEGLHRLFEQGRGRPGLILPMFLTLLAKAPGKTRIELDQLDQILSSWELP